MPGEWSPFRAYGGRAGWLDWPNLAICALFFALLLWLGASARALPAYDWSWSSLWDFLAVQSQSGQWRPGLLLRGLLATLRIGFWIILFSVFIGAFAGIWLYRGNGWLKIPILALINLFRNTPPLVILFCVYFFAGNRLPVSALEDALNAGPPFLRACVSLFFAPPGQMDAMLAAVLGLGLYQGAYVAEIVRGALQSVPQGQWDAARALGFGRRQTIILIILPQALRLAIPPMTGQSISTIKESALASLISLPELTFQSLEIMAVTNRTFEIWVTAGLLYWITGIACNACGQWLERRYGVFCRPAARDGSR